MFATIKAPPPPQKAPPFPKIAQNPSKTPVGIEDAPYPATDAPIPPSAQTDAYARQLARHDFVIRMHRFRSEEDVESQIQACAVYYNKLAADGTISRETADRWLASSIRFGVEATVIFRDHAAADGRR